jgi:uncharacterized protein involved in response to NO
MPKIILLVAAVVVGLFLGIGSEARAQDDTQSVTSHGLTVYFGLLPAAIAQGVAHAHGETDLHGSGEQAPSSYHLLVAIFNAVTGERIVDATIAASVTRPGSKMPAKRLEPMEIADTTAYGNFFDLPSEGIYRIRLSITRKGHSRPTEIDIPYDRHAHK